MTGRPHDPLQPGPRSSDAEETVEAIQLGKVDAFVVHGPDGPQVVMLQGSDVPYRALVERINDGALTLAGDGTILYANSRLAALTGIDVANLVGRNFDTLFVDGAPDRGGQEPTDAQLHSKAGSLPVSVWMSSLVIGGVASTLATVTDLSATVRAQEVATAERFARSILEQATDAIIVLTQDGRVARASAVAEALAAVPPIGRTFSDAFPIVADDNRAGALARFRRESLDMLLATKPFHGVEVKLRVADQGQRSFLLSAGPLLNDDKKSIGSIVTLTEITERKRSEEQQTMLVAELNHRVKNILAIVQSVAMQTVRNAASLDAFGDTFSGRIKALAVAHDLLTQTRWYGIGLGELLAAITAPYRGAREDRIGIDGPPVMLPAQAVLPLSMVFHELATNASKYGALSNASGVVTLRWEATAAPERMLKLEWRESGGPAATAPGAGGFGTKLIRRVVQYDLDGTIDMAYGPEGACVALEFPLRPTGLSVESPPLVTAPS